MKDERWEDEWVSMQTSDLRILRDTLLEDIASIKTQLEQDELRPQEDRDPEWGIRARTAQRIKGLQQNRLARFIADRDRQHRRGRNDTFERRFIETAKEHLPEEWFRFIVDTVTAELLDAKGNA